MYDFKFYVDRIFLGDIPGESVAIPYRIIMSWHPISNNSIILEEVISGSNIIPDSIIETERKNIENSLIPLLNKFAVVAILAEFNSKFRQLDINPFSNTDSSGSNRLTGNNPLYNPPTLTGDMSA